MNDFTQPDFTGQSGSAYKTNIDNAFAAGKTRSVGFNAQAQSTPDMTVKVLSGVIYDSGSQTLTSVADQNTATITAPASDPRIDRVVIDESTGSVSVITGTEAASPSAPAITAGNLPVAQISLTVSQTQIVNADITDEKATFIRSSGGLVKVSSNDTTAGDLEAKLLVGTGLSLSTQNDGANETRTIDHAFASQVEAEAGTATDKPMNALRTKQAIDANGFNGKLLHIQHQETSGTAGGAAATATIQTRVLNTVLTNEITGSSLLTNQITLPAGTYFIEAWSVASYVDGHKAYLYNVSDTSYDMIGSSEETGQGAEFVQTRSSISGRFTIASSKVYQVRHETESSRATDGLGRPSSFGETEVYADVKIWKVD